MTPEARLQIEADASGAGTGAARSRDLVSQVEQAAARATHWLLSAQAQDGYWWGELEADTTDRKSVV